MPTALSSFRTSLGYRLNDTGSPANYDSTQRNTWFNRGKDLVYREVPWALSNSNLTGINGVIYEFELSTILTRFQRIRSVSIPASGGSKLYRDPRGIAALMEIQMGGGPLGGTPSVYFVQNTKIFLNRIPATGTVVTIDFWQYPADLSADADTLGGLASIGWDNLFLTAAQFEAANDLLGLNREFAKVLRDEAKMLLWGEVINGRRQGGELDRFREFVVSELGHNDESLAIPYSELGGTDGVVRGGATVDGSDPAFIMSDYGG